jgi:glycosyltransferase involved in cell wall biosynthesis
MIISIITVCFNSVTTIEATLKSVSEQLYPHIEHLVIDGGSTDGTLDIVKSWMGHEISLVSGPDLGIYDAMNKGISMAHGDVIGFLNSDDRFADVGVVGLIAHAMHNEGIDFCYGDLLMLEPKMRNIVRHWKSGLLSRNRFITGWLPPHPTLYVKKNLVHQIGLFNLNYGVASDIEWMMRLLMLNANKFQYIPLNLVYMNAGGVSNSSLLQVLSANYNVWRACVSLEIPAVRFIVGKLFRKLLQLV